MPEDVVGSVEWRVRCTLCSHEYKLYGYSAIYDETQVVCPNCDHKQAIVLRMLPAWKIYSEVRADG